MTQHRRIPFCFPRSADCTDHITALTCPTLKPRLALCTAEQAYVDEVMRQSAWLAVSLLWYSHACLKSPSPSEHVALPVQQQKGRGLAARYHTRLAGNCQPVEQIIDRTGLPSSIFLISYCSQTLALVYMLGGVILPSCRRNAFEASHSSDSTAQTLRAPPCRIY